MKEIPLTRGKVAVVDDVDFERLSKHKWHAMKSPSGRYYAGRFVTVAPYTPGTGKQRRLILMHREVLGLSLDDPTKVDHKDDEGLNNWRNNLRPCTMSQNKSNTRKQKGAYSSIFKGVSFDKRLTARPWKAYVRVNQTLHSLGQFQTQEAAALAYNEAAVRYFGEFARINGGV